MGKHISSTIQHSWSKNGVAYTLKASHSVASVQASPLTTSVWMGHFLEGMRYDINKNKCFMM